MSWLLETLCSIFGAKLGGKSEAKWFHDSLAIDYYLLPTLFTVSAFVSWKTTVIAAGLLVVSLTTGAVTETHDLGAG